MGQVTVRDDEDGQELVLANSIQLKLRSQRIRNEMS